MSENTGHLTPRQEADRIRKEKHIKERDAMLKECVMEIKEYLKGVKEYLKQADNE